MKIHKNMKIHYTYINIYIYPPPCRQARHIVLDPVSGYLIVLIPASLKNIKIKDIFEMGHQVPTLSA